MIIDVVLVFNSVKPKILEELEVGVVPWRPLIPDRKVYDLERLDGLDEFLAFRAFTLGNAIWISCT